MKLTFLGTGTSHGLPYIGCDCDVCSSTDPKNKRLRSSILVEAPSAKNGATRLLVDTTPDLRQQFLREKLSAISAVMWTHTHNDHVIGLDDLRPVSDRCGYIDAFASESTLSHLKILFGYAFVQERDHPGYPRLTGHIIEGGQKFSVEPFAITPFPIWHGKNEIFAYRFECGGKTLVYATDCSGIPEASWPYFMNADVLVIDALRHRPHPTHFCIEQSLEVVSKVKPGRTYLTHIAHDLDHAATNAALPAGVELAYDGLTVDI